MNGRTHARRAIAPAVLAALLAACSDGTSPGIQPEINNLPDTFQYQVTAMQNYTHSDSYDWQNTGTQANVDQSTTVTGGTATLVILDADGTQVYERSLAENGSFTSTAGSAGTWTVTVVYADADATVNFRVQKRT